MREERPFLLSVGFVICEFVEKLHMVHIAISLDKQKVCTLLILSFLSLLLVRRKIAKDFSVAHILFYFFFALEHLYIFLYQPQWLIFQYNTYRIPCGYIFRVDQPSFKIAQLLFDCFWSDLHIPFIKL